MIYIGIARHEAYSNARRTYGGRRTEVKPVGSESIPAKFAKTETNGADMWNLLLKITGVRYCLCKREPFVNETPIFSRHFEPISGERANSILDRYKLRSREVYSCIGEQKIIYRSEIYELLRSHSNHVSKRSKTLRVGTLRAFYILSSVRSTSIRNVYCLCR